MSESKLLKKVNASWIGILGALITLITLFTAVALYMIDYPQFNIMENYISDLGDGPNGSNVVFNTGTIISGVIFFVFFVLIYKYFIGALGSSLLLRFGFISSIISAIGWIMVGIFTDKQAPDMHLVAAALYFFGALLFGLIYGLITYRKKIISKSHAYLGFFVAIFFTLFLTFFIFKLFNRGLLEEIAIFFEWFAYFSWILWILDHSILVLKSN
ncbi:MAG: DUF998 domain-containing protein [Candidatus Lokiarchaeota archaeon]|nr:DUF998 domain-containing protein [Candidatus Lokiarchaeota archaeon]MBD3337866.1 DUF998 domain-containing protein [Candidatus Lokiarchaeota archaeon]